jgi:DNA-directed RNA polymerase specialized sigma24 family protein
LLDTPQAVIRCLVTYADWWQPATTSILQVGAARRKKDMPEGFRPGLVDTLEERTELSRRTSFLDQTDRHILLLWYVKQLPVNEIAREIGLSRRQCFRRRSKAIETIVDLGETAKTA